MRNHYVPQYYTQQWALNAGKLWRYHRPYKKIVVDERLPVSVGVGDDIYTIPHLTDDLKYVLETVFFKKIDQEGCDVLRKMLGGSPISADEKLAWAVSVIAMRQRHPTKLQELAKDMTKEFELQLKETEKEYYSRREDGDTKSFAEYLEERKSDQWLEREKIAALRYIILLPRSLNWIASANWSIISPRGLSQSFLTSDRPVIMSNGLISPGGHIALPIGPNQLWVAAADRSVHEHIAGLPNLAAAVNEIVTAQAEEMVFGSDDQHTNFVDRRLRKKL